jgi:dual specificity tyrosine-phosphorylation-regulated kinase 2/3/4
LYDLLKKNQFKGISPTLIKRFSIQILQALAFIKRFRIIHCDLKPENILLVHISRSSLKVIDFGSSSFESNRIQTYIQSRFYRAPEVILGIPLTTAIDMWSFGCILAELATGNPLFSGEDEKEQLACMMEILGPPPIEVIQIASKREFYFDKEYNPIEMINSRGRKRYPKSKDLRTVLKGADEGLINLIEQCVNWSPSSRITPEVALQNAWLYENVKKPSNVRYSSASRSNQSQHLEEPRSDRRNKASYS